MSNRTEITPEYVYITIPAEYVCVYHRILAMLADYGEEMLKDCRASCTDRNKGAIECLHMFEAAVAARQLGQDKKASLLINYIKSKINQIYKGKDNSTSFVFPVDEKGKLKAFVSCGDRPKFWVNTEDMKLYKTSRNLGIAQNIHLDAHDKPFTGGTEVDTYSPVEKINSKGFDFAINVDIVDNRLNGGIVLYNDGKQINTSLNELVTTIYFDRQLITSLSSINNISEGKHSLVVIITNGDKTIMHKKLLTNT